VFLEIVKQSSYFRADEFSVQSRNVRDGDFLRAF